MSSTIVEEELKAQDNSSIIPTSDLAIARASPASLIKNFLKTGKENIDLALLLSSARQHQAATSFSLSSITTSTLIAEISLSRSAPIKARRVPKSRLVNPIGKLPLELRIMIFQHLDPVTATCCSLTCKQLREAHKAVFNRRVSLTDMNYGCVPLETLLGSWFKKAGYIYSINSGVFMKEERFWATGYI